MEWRCRGEYERSFLSEFQEVSALQARDQVVQGFVSGVFWGLRATCGFLLIPFPRTVD